MNLIETLAMIENKFDISNGNATSPEFKRTGWTRTLILSSCACHLIWSDTKMKYEPTADDIGADDWSLFPMDQEVVFTIFNRNDYLDFGYACQENGRYKMWQEFEKELLSLTCVAGWHDPTSLRKAVQKLKPENIGSIYFRR